MTISNSGNANLVISAISISGANAADFSFFMVGAFKTDEAIPLLARYVGSLPSTGFVQSNFVSRFGMKLASKVALEKAKPFKEPIVTEVVMGGPFYPAEEYHQDYYKKNPVRYNYYRLSCGRDARLKELWGSQAASH